MSSASIIAQKVIADLVANRGSEGGTLWNVPEKTTGYVVGGVIPELIFPWDISDKLVNGLVHEYFKGHANAVRKSDCVGWWEYRGNIYVDVNNHVADKAAAIELGRMNEQISIWDIANNCEIVL